MRFHFLLLVFLSHWRLATSEECPSILQAVGTSLGFVNGKCLVVTKSSVKGTSTTACKSVNTNVKFDIASIDNQAENDQIQNGLLTADVPNAYIGLTLGDTWSWTNNDPSTFQKWKNPPTTEPPTPAATTTLARTTLPPADQRISMAVVIGVDASLFSTNTLTFAQVEFVRRLSRYIGDRGPAEFAFFPYGCTQITPFTQQYPTFVNTFAATDAMILNLNETINHDCTKMNPLDFKTMFRDQTLYYNRYSTSVRPFRSKFISMIYFSASTDSDNIKATSTLWPIPNSTVITINVGSASVNVAPYSIPGGKNGLRVQTADDIVGLVPKVDSIIFGATGVEQHYQKEQDQVLQSEQSSNLISDASTHTDCAYMNATDGLWYSDGSCTTSRQFVCQYIPPTPAPPPTPNPTIEWSDPCFHESTNFTYFESLKNDKCYQLSTVKKQFPEAENACLYNHTLFLHKPDLSSIESLLEEQQLRTLTTGIPNEGMFWFGLRRNSSDSTWFFVNGDPFDASSSYANWRPGYPRDADGCDCVALVMNDNSWVNTDCNKQLYAICAYKIAS